MKKSKTILWGSAVLLLVILIGGRILRQARSDTLQDAYTGIVSVSGFVAETEPFTRLIEESGTLAGNKESTIAAETGGRVTEVAVEVGDYVKAGEPLVRLDDELYGLESERAKVAYDKATMDLDRLEKLYQDKSLSDSDIEGARLAAKGAEVVYRMALKTYNDATIRAPFNGTVASKSTEVGQMVERGMAVIQLVDISSLKLTVGISESDVKYVTPGAAATIVVEAAGDTVHGTVTAVGSRATSGARTFPVEVRLPGLPHLRSGMFARAIIAAKTLENALLVPRVAIVPDAGNTVVYLARGGTARKSVVVVIGTTGDRVDIDGIEAGDTVLTTGNQVLSHGSQIALTLKNPEVSAK